MTANKAQNNAALNDTFRSSLKGGRTVMTPRLNKLSGDDITALWRQVKAFNEFQAADSAHDFGVFTYEDVDFAWAISAADAETRVITLMLASEYRTAAISGPSQLEAARARRHMGML